MTKLRNIKTRENYRKNDKIKNKTGKILHIVFS